MKHKTHENNYRLQRLSRWWRHLCIPMEPVYVRLI